MTTSPLNNPPTANQFEPAALKKIYLAEGESLNVEAGAMLACKNVDMKTGINGTIYQVAKRYFFGGEGLFQNTYTAKAGGGWLALEEAVSGQINSYELQPGTSFTMGKGAYVASDPNVKVSAAIAGVGGWWKGLGFTKLKATVTDGKMGKVFFTSQKGVSKIIKLTNEDGPVIVDNNNLIAYTTELQSSLRKMGNNKSMMFSGEGMVNEFKGNGHIFVGSGESAARATMVEKITKAALEVVLPDPVTLINRVAVISALYIIAYSPHLQALADAINNAVTNGIKIHYVK